MENNPGIDEMKKMLNSFKSFEKDLSKMTSGLNSNLQDKFESIINQQIYDGEKKMKINKKPATVKLAKDGSILIIFDDTSNGKKFFNAEK